MQLYTEVIFRTPQEITQHSATVIYLSVPHSNFYLPTGKTFSIQSLNLKQAYSSYIGNVEQMYLENL